jgi:RNA polymerase sigma-70 factor (ECF subfamily)
VNRQTDPGNAETRFGEIFTNLGRVTAYARRRGSNDPEGVAAEAMTIAWRRLSDVPNGDPLPWLLATARNLVFAELRRERRGSYLPDGGWDAHAPIDATRGEMDADVAVALAALSPVDREALLLIAWDELTPTQASAVLGLRPTAFRVRLLRARRRFRAHLEGAASKQAPAIGTTSIELEEA